MNLIVKRKHTGQKGNPSLLQFSTHLVGSIALSIAGVEMQDSDRIFSRREDNKWAVSIGSSRAEMDWQ